MIGQLMKGVALAAVLCAGPALADSWTLDGDSSRLAFGSIKNDWNGEVHSFTGLEGSVTDEGAVSIEIDLGSVQTNIDIRNERMIEHVFKGIATANLNAQMDMEALDGIAVGGTDVIDVEGVLSFLGAELDVETQMFVARLSEKQVLVTTNDMIFLDIDDAGLTAGIDKLLEIAGLDGITRASPVTIRFMFNMDDKEA